MIREQYFKYIEEKLGALAYQIEVCGKLNMLDLNIHAETFYAGLFNLVFNYEFENLNVIEQNSEGIDLIDRKNKIIAQVSSTCTKAKVNNSLKKDSLKDYTEFRFIFISISKNASGLRDKVFDNPHLLQFDPVKDIYDIVNILRIVREKQVDQLKLIANFFRIELCSDLNFVKLDSNLTSIINILSSINLSEEVDSPEINAFEIDRKIEYNELDDVRAIINDYMAFYQKLDEKYKEFDKAGSNRSYSVLQMIRKTYVDLQKPEKSACNIYNEIVEKVISIVLDSKNYTELQFEELYLCAQIVVVDAFVRCKIFKNPEGYNHVIT